MPYEQHDNFNTPSDKEANIWRYMSFSKFLALLNDEALYFSRADKLTEMDPFEGSYTHVNIAVLQTKWNSVPPQVWASRNIKSEEDFNRIIATKKHFFDIQLPVLRETNFINCWHLGEDESDAMWKLYSSMHDSICVQTSFKNLVDSLADAEDVVRIGKVNYLDYSKVAIEEGMVFAPFLAKRRSFSHEQELRAMVWRPFDTENVFLNKDGSTANAESWDSVHQKNKYPNRHGINVPINVSELIKDIYVSPTSAPWFRDLVQSMVIKFGHGFDVKKSALAAPPPY